MTDVATGWVQTETASTPPPGEEQTLAFQTIELTPLSRVFGRVDPALAGQATIDLSRLTPVQRTTEGHQTQQHRLSSTTIGADGSWEVGGLVVPDETDALTGLRVDLVEKGARRSLVLDFPLRPGEQFEVLDRSTPGAKITLEFAYPSGLVAGPDMSLTLRRTVEGDGPAGAREEVLSATLDAAGKASFASGRVLPGSNPQETIGYDHASHGLILSIGEEQEAPVVTRVTSTDLRGELRFDLVPKSAQGTLRIAPNGRVKDPRISNLKTGGIDLAVEILTEE